MKPVVDALERVARTAATVLLQGESGTGKEVLARAIHATGPRAGKPFVAINCAVLTESCSRASSSATRRARSPARTPSVAGASSWPTAGRSSSTRSASCAVACRPSCCACCEERRFERVGGSTSIGVDVRWIAATHRDLAAMVREGTFREDLYHRLAVFPLEVPPLRDRREDIVPLAENLLAQLAVAAGRTPPGLTEATRARIVAAPGRATCASCAMRSSAR